jgi:hypothetical protein
MVNILSIEMYEFMAKYGFPCNHNIGSGNSQIFNYMPETGLLPLDAAAICPR